MDDELARIRQRKMEELLRRRQELTTPAQPKPPRPKAIVEVFTSPGCPHCPRTLMMARQAEAQMQEIIVKEVSTASQQGYARARQMGIQAVPTIFVNGRMAFLGAPRSLAELKHAILALS